MQPWRPNRKRSLLPGLSITGLVILIRLLGLQQFLEWKIFDLSLRWRPAETTDPRITLVTITEEDIQTTLNYPISDRSLAELIQTIQSYNPRTVGVDIFRDQPVGEGYEVLSETLQSFENIVGIYKLDPKGPVLPPPALPEEQIGFADAILDKDGFLRRSLLGEAAPEGDYRFSFTIQLVRSYLASEEITLENGIRDPETMRFGPAEIPRFQQNTGGYIRTDRGGNQALINFRAGPLPFDKITYQSVLSGQVDPALLDDRLVLIGYTAASVKDFVSSGAIAGLSPSLVPGVDAQAHAVSQILSAVVDQRPFLKVLPDSLEYLLILGSGFLGVALVYWQRQPSQHLLTVVIIGSTILLLSYGLLIVSWWIPGVPMVAAFLLNTAILYPFYQAQAYLRSQLNERQQLINQTYNTIHNGPLQILAGILSTWPEGEPAPQPLRQELCTLNQELRALYETMRQEMLVSAEQLVLTGHQAVDLQMPLEELLREAYQFTLERHPDFFDPILKIISFEPMNDHELKAEHKRALGRFLEEALLNVEKYAKMTTRLTVECRQQERHNVIRVIDNGEGLKNSSSNGGYGTKQAHALAHSLRGQFKRIANGPDGVCCELRWPIKKPSSWKRYWKR